jgi:hypothetical protein
MLKPIKPPPPSRTYIDNRTYHVDDMRLSAILEIANLIIQKHPELTIDSFTIESMTSGYDDEEIATSYLRYQISVEKPKKEYAKEVKVYEKALEKYNSIMQLCKQDRKDKVRLRKIRDKVIHETNSPKSI